MIKAYPNNMWAQAKVGTVDLRVALSTWDHNFVIVIDYN